MRDIVFCDETKDEKTGRVALTVWRSEPHRARDEREERQAVAVAHSPGCARWVEDAVTGAFLHGLTRDGHAMRCVDHREGRTYAGPLHDAAHVVLPGGRAARSVKVRK